MSEIILICVFSLWPETQRKPAPEINFDKNAVVVVEEIIQTRQPNAAAAPPKPRVSVVAPEFEIIEDELPEFPDIDEYLKSEAIGEKLSTGSTGTEARISGNPDRPPRVVRIVEPALPEEAKKADIKAMVYVRFEVDKEGIVQDAYIDEIRLFKGKSDEYTLVDDLGYGILPATIEAAFKWRFSPARDKGEKVGAYARDIFTFGF